MEKVLVIGGLGFIGHHLVNTLQASSFLVTVSSRSLKDASKYRFPTIHLDLLKMTDDQISGLIAPFDHIIFAGGSDDRNIPIGDAYPFFYEGNVVPCKKLARLSSDLKTKKIIILGSYFSYFNREKPQWKLSQKHPYILSREQQLNESIEAAQGKTQVSTVEIPYVFGSAPNHIPLWKPLIDYIYSWPIIFYTKGGTNIIAVEELAKAITGVLKTNKYQTSWLVGGVNISWTKMINVITQAKNKKKKVVIVPTFILKGFARILKLYFKLKNKSPGLDPYYFLDVQAYNTFLNTEKSRKILGYGETDIEAAISDTVKACLSNTNETI